MKKGIIFVALGTLLAIGLAIWSGFPEIKNFNRIYIIEVCIGICISLIITGLTIIIGKLINMEY